MEMARDEYLISRLENFLSKNYNGPALRAEDLIAYFKIFIQNTFSGPALGAKFKTAHCYKFHSKLL